MSRKQIYGITLTDDEKRMAGYDRWYAPRQTADSGNAAAPPSQGPSSHVCQVRLPDGTDCRADYTRYGDTSHMLSFGPPLNKRVYGQGCMGDTQAIETLAQSQVGDMWRRAQAKEAQTMRLASAPPHLVYTLDKEPQLQRKTAQRFAGMYTVCLRYPSGTLTPVSQAVVALADARTLLNQMQAASSQPLVIGICCRWARRWQIPRFLAEEAIREETSDTADRADDDPDADEAMDDQADPEEGWEDEEV